MQGLGGEAENGDSLVPETDGATVFDTGKRLEHTNEDSNAYNTRRRLEQVHDSRTRVLNMMHRVNARRATHGIGEYDANTALRGAVEGYIIDVEWLLRNPPTKASLDRGRTREQLEDHYWFDVELGTMRTKQESVAFTGLSSILDAPNPFEVSWEEQSRDVVTGGYTEERQEAKQIPWKILVQAFRTVNSAVADLGLEIEIEEGAENEWEI